MSAPPAQPKIYHITHVDNLPAIIAGGELASDSAMIRRGGPAEAIGMSNIKERRLTLPVICHDGDFVGDYVPFYFCPRSVMLYLIYRANHPDLTYRGGQDPIVHLEADLHTVVEWANREDRHWAFSSSNAGSNYALFSDDLDELANVDWEAVAAVDWAGDLQEGKQAEFLLRDSFPWELVTGIGVRTLATRAKVELALTGCAHVPPLEILPDWYY